MLPPLFARQPVDPIEERRIRRLANARQAPAGWPQRARIVTSSWDGAQVGQIAEALGCHPRTVYAGCTASTTAASTASVTCPARVGPDGLGSWSVASSSRWRGATHRDGWCASPTAPWWWPMRTSQHTGRWLPSPTPPWPRGSRSAAARSAGSCWPRRCAGGRCAPGAAAAMRTSPQPGGDHRPFHHPAARGNGPLRRRVGPGHPRSFPPPPGWSTDGHRSKAPLDYGRGQDKTWGYGACDPATGRRSP
jgi:hypothetical protein